MLFSLSFRKKHSLPLILEEFEFDSDCTDTCLRVALRLFQYKWIWLNSLLWVMLLYPLTDSLSPEAGGHWQGTKMDRAGPAAAWLCSDHGANRIRFPVFYSAASPSGRILSDCLKRLPRRWTPALDFHVLCSLS